MTSIANGNLENSSVNSNTPQLQETNSFYGRVVSAISRNSSYITQAISSIAQSILSTGIYIGSLGRYTLEDLKDYFFPQQAETTHSDEITQNNGSQVQPIEQLNVKTKQGEVFTSMGMPPPAPPPLPTTEQLNTTARQSQLSSISTVVAPVSPFVATRSDEECGITLDSFNSARENLQVSKDDDPKAESTENKNFEITLANLDSARRSLKAPKNDDPRDNPVGNKNVGMITLENITNTRRSLKAPKDDDPRVKPAGEKKKGFNFLSNLRNNNNVKKKI